jgi:hypothetical protein
VTNAKPAKISKKCSFLLKALSGIYKFKKEIGINSGQICVQPEDEVSVERSYKYLEMITMNILIDWEKQYVFCGIFRSFTGFSAKK